MTTSSLRRVEFDMGECGTAFSTHHHTASYGLGVSTSNAADASVLCTSSPRDQRLLPPSHTSNYSVTQGAS